MSTGVIVEDITDRELDMIDDFRFRKEMLAGSFVLLQNQNEKYLKIYGSENSRYFEEGRKKIQNRIKKRMGKWFTVKGLMLSLTFDPKLIERDVAWNQIGVLRRRFMNNVNQWRRNNKYKTAMGITVIEEQPGTGYPHLHIVFPYLRWLAPLARMIDWWGQQVQSVDILLLDGFSPVSYICKYISKLSGWSDLALAYIYEFKIRLYSLSRVYCAEREREVMEIDGVIENKWRVVGFGNEILGLFSSRFT